MSQEEAVAKVLASDPRFSGIGPLDPDLIGQSAWYEVSPATVGWRVVITRAGATARRDASAATRGRIDVDGAGVVTLVDESGDPLPDGSGGTGDGSGGVAPGTPPVAIPATVGRGSSVGHWPARPARSSRTRPTPPAPSDRSPAP